ncbi:MAG: hypothetical protein WCR31_12450 [Treponema sp.]
MENPYTIPVILTGTLARTPRASLTGADRTVECLLRVRTRHIRFAGSAPDEPVKDVYIVHVSGILHEVLFLRADKGCRVVIPGYLAPGTAGISTDIVYKLPE